MDDHKDLIRRLAFALEICLDHLDKQAAAEARAEAGKTMRCVTAQRRAEMAHGAVDEALKLLGMGERMTITDEMIGRAARAICRERRAFMGEPPCWAGQDRIWPNICDGPACEVEAKVALDAALSPGASDAPV